MGADFVSKEQTVTSLSSVWATIENESIIASVQKDDSLDAATSGSATTESKNVFASDVMSTSSVRISQQGNRDLATVNLEHSLRKKDRIFDDSIQELTDAFDNHEELLEEELLDADTLHNVQKESGKPGPEYDIYKKKWLKCWVLWGRSEAWRPRPCPVLKTLYFAV